MNANNGQVEVLNLKLLKQILIDKHYICVLKDMSGPCDINVIDGKRVPIAARSRTLPEWGNNSVEAYTEKVADFIKEKHPDARYYSFYELRLESNATVFN